MWLVILLTVVSSCAAQLFPFSNLHHIIDQRAEATVSATLAPPPVDNYRYLQEVASSALPASTGRTVLVTPRPRKYVPHRLVQEPQLGPNSESVPSIEIAEHREAGPPPVKTISISPDVSAVKKGELKLSRQQGRPLESTIVESIPSLSVTISEPKPRRPVKKGEIPDYLTPPLYPSVYSNFHDKDGSIAGIIDVPKIEFRSTSKPKTKKKSKSRKRYKGGKRNQSPPVAREPEKDGEDTKTAGSKQPKKRQPFFRRYEESHPVQEQIAAETSIGLGSVDGERVQFQLHGQEGPESYKFGFDTGNGKNRHFRYEEKDSQGHVKGHYGYYDLTGKLQVVNYHADDHGFHASSS